jgi:hypothetical protein
MSSRVIVLLEDDVDGTRTEETIEFRLDGVTYAIDLSDYNAKKLRGALDGYISKHLFAICKRRGIWGAPNNITELAPTRDFHIKNCRASKTFYG